jgi:membrane protein DedA with SNARE-associated domain
MFETLLKYFQDSPLSLWGPFLVLILCGLGLPVPEDIVLVVAGVLGVMDGRSWIDISVVMYAGVMIGDSTIFLAGRFFGGKLRNAPRFQRYFPVVKQAKVERLFDRYHSLVLFFGRFLPGLRAPIFFTAGSMKVGYWKFFFFDGLAALVSVPFFVWLGHWLWDEFQDDIVALQHVLSHTHFYTMLVAVVIGTGLLIAARIWWRRVHSHKE